MFFLLECFVHAFQCVIHMLFRMKLAKQANSNEEQEMGDNLHLPDLTQLCPTLPDLARLNCMVCEQHGSYMTALCTQIRMLSRYIQ